MNINDLKQLHLQLYKTRSIGVTTNAVRLCCYTDSTLIVSNAEIAKNLSQKYFDLGLKAVGLESVGRLRGSDTKVMIDSDAQLKIIMKLIDTMEENEILRKNLKDIENIAKT